MVTYLSFLLWSNAALSGVLLGTILYKIWLIYDYRKKETVALFINKDGTVGDVHSLKKVQKDYFVIEDCAYVIGEPQVKYRNKKLLFYIKGVAAPVNIFSLKPDTIDASTFNYIIKNELVKELARLRDDGISDWLARNWKAVLLITIVAVGAYMLLTGGLK